MAIIYTIEFEELKIIGYKEKWMRLQDKQSIIANNCEYFIQNGWYYKRKIGKIHHFIQLLLIIVS